MAFAEEIARAVSSRAAWARDLLGDLIRLRSTTGDEARVQDGLRGTLTGLGFSPRSVSLERSLVHDPDYSPVPGSMSYDGRPNIILRLSGSGGGRSVILNSHTDVVPGPDRMFEPRWENGLIHGRGACDAKGQVVTIILTLLALRDLGLRLRGDVEAQFVIEEEAGGNGTLAAILGGPGADAAVVLEPTGLGLHRANRGAAWFKLSVKGRSVHMGRYAEGVSAFEEMVGLTAILKRYEAFLRSVSKGYPGFPDDPSPVVVNIGRVSGGDWPSTLPAECLVEGGVAFLPNRDARTIENEVRSRIEAEATPWAREHARFELAGLRNEAFETPEDHPVVLRFREAAEAVLGPREDKGWVASCDARLFFHRGGMPTLVFGAGDLSLAHSQNESIALSDILRAAEVLGRFLADWCGLEGQEG